MPPQRANARGLAQEVSAPMQRKSVFRGGVGMKSRTTQAKELRRQGLTYQAIADQLGVSYGAIHSWINGDRKERPPNPLVDLECVGCGRTIQRRQADAEREHRCVTCANRHDKQRGRMLVCAECGDEFYCKPSEEAKGRKYCTRTCWRKNARLTDAQYEANAKRMSKQRRGAGNPRHKHGKAQGRNIRGMTVARKGEDCCRACGSAGPLHLHHAVPRSLSPEGRGDLRNGVVLCASCHKKWHSGNPIPRDVFTADEWAFIQSLIGPTWLDKRYPSESFRRAA